MSTYREIVYMILDELKGMSDDFTYTEDHVLFLISKYRSFLLKQRYSDIKKQISESNYQTLCLSLESCSKFYEDSCEISYLKSTIQIPYIMKTGITRVYTSDYFKGDISFIAKERMRYVGHNKWLQNIIYSTLGPDHYLYLKSNNPQFLYLKNIKIYAIFQDCVEASKLIGTDKCDILDLSFPLESALIPPLLDLVVKELTVATYKPEDNVNNASDDLAKVKTK